MDPWRIALLAAVGIFVLFLLLKMRPSLEGDEGDDAVEESLEPLETRAERATWRRIRKLPPASQERILTRLDHLVERGSPPPSPESLAGDSQAGDPPESDA